MTDQVEFSDKVEPEVSSQPLDSPGLPGQETAAKPEGWNEIGQHFWVLGESLNTALKAAWQREENQQQLHKLQTGLQEVVEHVGQTVIELVESPEFRHARLEVEKAAQPAQAAGQRAFHEIQPYLLTALRQFRGEVDKLISHLEQPAPAAGEPAEPETGLPAGGPASLAKGSPPNTHEV
jgi:hypothetical protein